VFSHANVPPVNENLLRTEWQERLAKLKQQREKFSLRLAEFNRTQVSLDERVRHQQAALLANQRYDLDHEIDLIELMLW
jgi:hypothetical protein